MVCLSFEHIGNYDFGNVPVVKNEEFEDIPVQDVTIQYYSRFDFTTIEFVSKFEKIEREIFEINEGINESKVDMSPYMVKYSPECDIDGEAVKAKFFTRREEVRRPYITEQSKTIYWNPNTFVDTKYPLSVGNDENDGETEATAFKTLEHAWDKIPTFFKNNYTIKIITSYRVGAILKGGKYSALFGRYIRIVGNDTSDYIPMGKLIINNVHAFSDSLVDGTSVLKGGLVISGFIFDLLTKSKTDVSVDNILYI